MFVIVIFGAYHFVLGGNISLCLCREQFVILALFCHEFVMISGLDDLPVLKHDYLVCGGGARKPV